LQINGREEAFTRQFPEYPQAPAAGSRANIEYPCVGSDYAEFLVDFFKFVDGTGRIAIFFSLQRPEIWFFISTTVYLAALTLPLLPSEPTGCF